MLQECKRGILGVLLEESRVFTGQLANWYGRQRKDLEEKQQEIQRHTFHLVFPKYWWVHLRGDRNLSIKGFVIYLITLKYYLLCTVVGTVNIMC